MTSLNIQVNHGSDRHDLVLSLGSEDADDELTLAHLSKEIARVIKVPMKSQKIICKGKSLVDQFAPLRTLGVKNNSKIMLLGSKVSKVGDISMATMSNVEGELTSLEKRLTDTGIEVQGIKNGYLPAELIPAALKKLGLDLQVCAEEFTRRLERLDALTLADASPNIRQRRKNLVERIQGFLDHCDSLKTEVLEQKQHL